ncbi:MAG: hypothetical protein SGARI_000151 [Bacillariaceae sp.]
MVLVQTAKSKYLDNDDFIMMAQMEAVLFPMARLGMILQTDRFGSNSVSFLHIFQTWVVYLLSESWWVVECDAGKVVDTEHRWHAQAQYPKRNVEGEPFSTDKPSFVEFTWTENDKTDLEPMCQKLIERFGVEFTKYSIKVNNDQLLAMACNPLSATIGMSNLEDWVALVKELEDETHLPFLLNYRVRCKNALVQCIKKMFVKLPDANAPVPAARAKSKGGLFGKRRKLNAATTNAKAADPIVDEVNKFFAQELDFNSILTSQQVNAQVVLEVGTTMDKYRDNWFLIAKHFKLMQWWESFGKSRFPHIYHVATIYLALPESNGHQERTFSSATWFDGKLNNRQLDATMEMKTMIYRNKQFLKELDVEADMEHKKLAARATKALLVAAAKRKPKAAPKADDDGVDSEPDDSEDAEMLLLLELEEAEEAKATADAIAAVAAKEAAEAAAKEAGTEEGTGTTSADVVEVGIDGVARHHNEEDEDDLYGDNDEQDPMQTI